MSLACVERDKTKRPMAAIASLRPTSFRPTWTAGAPSLPFVVGDDRGIAVKIVDDCGIESLKIVNLED